METAAQSSVEMRGCPQPPQAREAAIAMCFDQVREKQNREALRFFCLPFAVNPRNSVRHARASRETAHLKKNDPEQSARSKKRRLTLGSKADSDQANARADYTPIAGF
jgi:hypothetical protein